MERTVVNRKLSEGLRDVLENVSKEKLEAVIKGGFPEYFSEGSKEKALSLVRLIKPSNIKGDIVRTIREERDSL